jgi:hypothetical protein
MTLYEFIHLEARKPFRWGETDCIATADRWICAQLGFSPRLNYGRAYETEEDAREWLAEPGSIAVAVNRVMREAGIPKTKHPLAGDVGLIFHAGDQLCGAINTGTYWFSRDEHGFIGEPLTACWKAWKIG